MKASAIILAAGQGTRMKSKKPKVAHEVLGKPLVRWVVDAAKNAGISSIVSVVGHGRELVTPLLEDTTLAIQEEQLGTAHAVTIALESFDSLEGSVVVLTGDSPLIRAETIRELVDLREKEDAACVVLTMNIDNPFGYGRIIRDEKGDVCRIVEQKDCTESQAQIKECNSGFYCFDAKVLSDALKKVSTNNAQGEYYLTDVLGIAREEGRIVLGHVAKDSSECLGVNSRVQLAEATKILQNRINTYWMEQGVTMTDPNTVWIGPDVELSSDVELLPNVMIYGASKVGEDTVIGPTCRIVDTVVGQSCVLEETIALEAQIDNGASCGPRAYLRPATHLCEGAKAGTHVEIKKSTIGKGSKVPHLSYVGDATIGSDANLGAGTITCNYDGENKWPTTIGDRSFIGSDTMLVAPVVIGKDTLIGAGSVITSDVPDGALGLGRARQFVKEGYKEVKN